MNGADGLGIGQIGLGGITVVHREGYRLYGQPVVGGFDPDPAACERFAADSPDARVHESVEGLLADPAVGVVDLATPHHRTTRLPPLEAIAAAGKPVLIQKPLAMNYSDAAEVADILAGAGIVGMVNQNMCFTPSALTLERALMVDRAIGKPFLAQIDMHYQFDTAYHPWFGRDDRWWTVGLTVHHLGLLQLLFGPPETVFALIGGDPRQPGVTKDGWGHLALVYPNGLQVLVGSTGTYYGSAPIRHGSEAIWIQGEAGILDWQPNGDVTVSTRSQGDGEIERRTVSPVGRGTWFPHAFGLAMAHFRQALAAGELPLCSVPDNLYVMAVIEAAYTSAEQHRAVQIAEIMGDRHDPSYGTGWSHGYAEWTPPTPTREEIVA